MTASDKLADFPGFLYPAQSQITIRVVENGYLLDYKVGPTEQGGFRRFGQRVYEMQNALEMLEEIKRLLGHRDD